MSQQKQLPKEAIIIHLCFSKTISPIGNVSEMLDSYLSNLSVTFLVDGWVLRSLILCAENTEPEKR